MSQCTQRHLKPMDIDFVQGKDVPRSFWCLLLLGVLSCAESAGHKKMQVANSPGVGPVILSDGPEPRWQHGFGIEVALQTGDLCLFCLCSDTSQLFAGACGVDLQSFLMFVDRQQNSWHSACQQRNPLPLALCQMQAMSCASVHVVARPGSISESQTLQLQWLFLAFYHVVLFCAAQVLAESL